MEMEIEMEKEMDELANSNRWPAHQGCPLAAFRSGRLLLLFFLAQVAPFVDDRSRALIKA